MSAPEMRFLLWSNKHQMWWRPFAQGYTANRDEAGRFSEEAALAKVLASSFHDSVAHVTCMIAEPGLGLPDADADPERVFAKRMRAERLRRGWRQQDLANMLSAVGVDLHHTAIAKMETRSANYDYRGIRLSEAAAIADLFGLTVTDMLAVAS